MANFKDINKEDDERIEKLAEIMVLIGTVRVEIEEAGLNPEWSKKLMLAQEMVDDLV